MLDFLLKLIFRTLFVCMFRSPLVSFLYERGWRQNFARSGFPGPDEEVHGTTFLFFFLHLMRYNNNMIQKFAV